MSDINQTTISRKVREVAGAPSNADVVPVLQQWANEGLSKAAMARRIGVSRVYLMHFIRRHQDQLEDVQWLSRSQAQRAREDFKEN